jgi:hypothetical protein
MSGDKKQNKTKRRNKMSRQDNLTSLHNWTTEEHMKPLTFWQAFCVHAVMAVVALLPFTLILSIIVWIITR